MVDPAIMCDQHLLGEHVELHMLTGTLQRGKSVAGYVRDGLVELHRIRSRHRALVAEMTRRGMNHQSPLPEFPRSRGGAVDPDVSRRELHRRCARCRARQTRLLR